MSFDISNFLKNEIAKKTHELRESVHLEKTQHQVDSSEGLLVEEESNGDSDDELKPSADTSEDLKDQITKLQTRQERIKERIYGDLSFSSDIDPLTIAASEKSTLLALQCNIYIHSLLNGWATYADEYHEELLLDTKKSLFPLLVQLRKGTLARDLVVSIATVLYHLQQTNEITLAIESYMKLSIGNVAWPIGVTSIGIHARSANAKIQGENGQIANIMVDDRTRSWITCIKRLISFKEWLDKRSK